MIRTTRIGCTVLVAASIAAAPCAARTENVDSWQMKRLFQPTDTQLSAEGRGRVMIYEGLEEKTVNRAMDHHFSRIDSMMFVGTVRNDADGDILTDPGTGEAVTEDDGCD